MPSVVFYFHVHQPYRIKPYGLFDIGNTDQYFDSQEGKTDNRAILEKVAKKCYLPTNATLLEILKSHPEFHCSFSITGVVLEQLSHWFPQVVDSFKRLIDTGRVEIVAETYYHSLASLYSTAEFTRQIKLHQNLIHSLFNVRSTSFRNTELIYYDGFAKLIERLGFSVILAEGVDRYLGWRSPNYVYKPPQAKSVKLLLKNYRLSDDIAFRFSDRSWSEFPLTAEKYAHWLSAVNGNGHVINLFMDYETFGEHQWADTGIFDFLHHLPKEILKNKDMDFKTVSQAAASYPVADTVTMPEMTSWADLERDITAWRGNAMQDIALKSLYELESPVLKSNNPFLIDSWRKLTTSDHFYYMCTKWFNDGDVHKYFSPNETPYEAFTHFMNILHDMRARVYAYS